MNIAKLSANGQITVPIEIRRSLGLKAGDKMLFIRKDDGEIVVLNASNAAISGAQSAVAGTVYTEEEILADVMELRYSKKSP